MGIPEINQHLCTIQQGMDQGEDLHPAAEAGRPEVDCSG